MRIFSGDLIIHLDSGSEGIFLPYRFSSGMPINSTWDFTLNFPKKKQPILLKNLKVGIDIGFLPPKKQKQKQKQKRDSTMGQTQGGKSHAPYPKTSSLNPNSMLPERPVITPLQSMEFILGIPFFNKQSVIFVSKQNIKKTLKKGEYHEIYETNKKASCVIVN